MEILDAYVATAPSAQNVVDIFKGEWSSRLPQGSGLFTSPATANLFDDARIKWVDENIGGFLGRSVLELGPLEAGHTYMMHAAGANSILAVESNSRAFLKCLCVKEIFNLYRAKFIYGDALEFAADAKGSFDICVASGILYHMVKPLEFIESITKLSNALFIWTHYYDHEIISRSAIKRQFEAPQEISFNGKTYMTARRNYLEALKWAGFCGGSKPWALWLTRDSLLSAIESCGFTIKTIGFDHRDHPSGPALALIAERA